MAYRQGLPDSAMRNRRQASRIKAAWLDASAAACVVLTCDQSQSLDATTALIPRRGTGSLLVRPRAPHFTKHISASTCTCSVKAARSAYCLKRRTASARVRSSTTVDLSVARRFYLNVTLPVDRLMNIAYQYTGASDEHVLNEREGAACARFVVKV